MQSKASCLSFGILITTTARPFWKGDQPNAKPLPTESNNKKKRQEILRSINHLLSFHCILSIWHNTAHIENTASNSSCIVTCVFIIIRMCSPSHCLAMSLFWFHYPGFRCWGGEGVRKHSHQGVLNSPFTFFKTRKADFKKGQTHLCPRWDQLTFKTIITTLPFYVTA